jgi:hydrogenase maturation factor
MSGVDAVVPAGAPALPESLAATALTLARRFGAGATMFCLSTQWPSHGQHVAVEFVHPVIVGKRALPSVHVEGGDPAGTLRLLARPGDVLLAVSTADDPTAVDVLRRAEAWGLTRVWLGTGPRPAASRAEHVVWLEGGPGQPGRAAHSGDVVLLYHLLWELTHVVFEHPGLVAEQPCGDEVCVTCSDQGEVAEVRSLSGDGRAQVVAGGLAQQVDVSLIDQVGPGDLVLIHAGIAISALGGAGP